MARWRGWTGKTGKPFATALLRAESQGETLWVNVVAFSEAAQAELLGIKTGEALSIQGSLKVQGERFSGGICSPTSCG